jgi:hypothetical protein
MGSGHFRICPPGDREHINNGPKASFAHGRRKQANRVESSDEVHRQNSLPLAGRHLSQAMSPSFALRRNASIVTDRVAAFQTVLKFAASLGQLVALGDVELPAAALPPRLANTFGDLLHMLIRCLRWRPPRRVDQRRAQWRLQCLALTHDQNPTTAMAGAGSRPLATLGPLPSSASQASAAAAQRNCRNEQQPLEQELDEGRNTY